MMQELYPLLTCFVFVFGACVGSFLNVVVWRLPRGESLVRPGSHCPRCNHAIRPWENIPLVSWLLLRARCSSCREPISVRYPLVEAATAALMTYAWARVWDQGLPLGSIPGVFYLTASLLAISLIDLEHYLIPDKITLTGIALAICLSVALPGTHPVLPSLTDTGPDPHFWTLGLATLLSRIWPDLSHSARACAVLDSLLGAGVGFGFLWAVAELGKKLWGTIEQRVEEPVPLEISRSGVTVGDVYADEWEFLLYRASDRFDADVSDLQLCASGTDTEPPLDLRLPEAKITVGGDGVSWGEGTVPLERVERIVAHTTRWRVPREAMGFGDVKLLAMIGAFLGPEACLVVVMISALAGSVVGVGANLLLPSRRHEPIPYGPFLALGAYVWMFWGVGLMELYARLLFRVG